MTIWSQHGSDHSANLVMIGHFEDVAYAEKSKNIIERLTNQVREEKSDGTRTIGHRSERYSDAMLDLLGKLDIGSIGPSELEQFLYDVDIKANGNDLVLTTEVLDISAFLKVMLLNGARVEIYSAHDYPHSEHGRGPRWA